MTQLWCEMAWLGGENALEGVVIDIEGDAITGVTVGAAAPADAERLPGLTLPGMANAHSHAFQRALRGRTENGTGSFWTWREQMYALAESLDPDSYRRLARATFAEMALAGITLVGEFHYLHHGPGGAPYDDPNAMGAAVIAAAREAGIRITLLDACYLHGGIGKPPDDAQRRFADGTGAAWRERVQALEPGPGVRIGAAIHSVRAVDPDSAAIVADWARGRDLPLHAHVSEQPAENAECMAAYGATPSALLERAGALSRRFTAVHATHLAEDDFRLLGRAGVTCCLCPTTERNLADGIGPGRRLVDGGARLALGSDSQAAIDLFEEARAVELDERLATGTRGLHPAPELLQAATAGGYDCLGWPGGGRIEPGGLADLLVLSLDGVRMAGTTQDFALESAVHAASAGDVRHVMAAGRWIVRDGRHLEIDAAAELREALSS